jgi:hypothetical protein
VQWIAGYFHNALAIIAKIDKPLSVATEMLHSPINHKTHVQGRCVRLRAISLTATPQTPPASSNADTVNQTNPFGSARIATSQAMHATAAVRSSVRSLN